MEKWLKSTSSIRIVAIVAALLVWLYVILVLDPEITVEMDDIAVSYLNQTPLEKQGIKFVGNKDTTVTVKVSGKRSVIAKISPESFNAVADLNGVQWPATHQLSLRVATPDGTIIRDVVPSQTTVTLDRFDSIGLPIKVNLKGTPKDGFFSKVKDIEPKNLMINAPAKLVESIAHATVDISINNAENDFSSTSSISIIDKNGNEIESPDITKNVDKATVVCSIFKQNKINIQPNISGLVNEKYTLKTEIEPKNVTVYAPSNDIEALKIISTTPIHVNGLKESMEVFADIILPDGISLADGQPDKVKVKLTVERK